MGVDSNFPGPPLPPNGLPRNPLTMLGNFLSNLQFAFSRLNPYMYRAGELLQRERNMSNPLDRAETQQLTNQIGIAMEELGRALILSSHLYRNLRIGEVPGAFRIANQPHPDFAELNNAFIEEQFAPGVHGEEYKQDVPNTESTTAQTAQRQAQTQAPAPTSTPTPAPASRPTQTSTAAQSSPATQPSTTNSARPQASQLPGQPRVNIFAAPHPLGRPAHSPVGISIQNLFGGQNMGELTGAFGNLAQLFAGGAQPQQRAQPHTHSQPSTQPSPSSNAARTQTTAPAQRTTPAASRSQDVPMEPARHTEEAKSSSVREESKSSAQNVQDRLNQNFISNITNIASSPQSPLGGLLQSMMPILSAAGSDSNTFNIPLKDLITEEDGQEMGFIMKVIQNLTLQDLIALMNGNFEITNSLHETTRDILMSEYMYGEDTPEHREVAGARISDEINSGIFIPEELKSNIRPGKDPLEIIHEINNKHVHKIVTAIFDINVDPESSSIFLKRIQRLVRWWIGETIDNLKPVFKNQLPDVVKFLRANIEKGIKNSASGAENEIINGVMVDTTMQKVVESYNQYLKDKAKEDEAEAKEMGISLQEFYNRRSQAQEDVKMEVDEDPIIEEEGANNAPMNVDSNEHEHNKSKQSNSPKETPGRAAPEVEENKNADLQQNSGGEMPEFLSLYSGMPVNAN